MVPTLWLPISSIFPGPTVSGLLSLTGLDCIFNLGASLFLLMADSAARAGPDESSKACKTGPPLDYRVFNVLANITGFVVPLLAYLGSENGLGLLQPRMGFVPFAVLLGPYLLLLTVQMLTEMLTWQWGSPVWLVAPLVYEGYRLLQLMRGLGLGQEMGVPAWTVHVVRGLVCGWVLVFGVQLMRVAWYAGFTASGYRRLQEFEVSGDG
ncbi:protein kinase family protein [Striga asiatica]|uniref:Protein kinase family protein n=1 Tax=Striga asiatica TaxID=4170 RepID=A0A5A7QM99_STRAF|nr:protein kinase family protein [Striga asiatica]